MTNASFQNPAGNFVTNADGFAYPAAFGGTLAVMHGTFAFDDTFPKTLFTLPAGAVPVMILVDVITDFDAATNNNMDLGAGSDDDYFANDVAIGTQNAFLPTATGFVRNRLGVGFAEETDVTATYAESGTAATQGEARVILFYYTGNGE